MFEIGDIVRFRHWSNRPWEEGTWIIIDQNVIEFGYGDRGYTYDIQNQKTGEVHSEVNWQQIETI